MNRLRLWLLRRLGGEPRSDERLPGWENEDASDSLFDPAVLERVREVAEQRERDGDSD